MAISYPIPPWLNPAAAQGWGQLYARGRQLGIDRDRLAIQAAQSQERIGLERQRLAQSAALAQIQLEARQQNLDREALRRQQELEIDKAYKEAVIGVREREMEQRAAKIGFDLSKAMRRFQAGQQIARVMSESEGKVTPDVLNALAEAEATPGEFVSMFGKMGGDGTTLGERIEIPGAPKGVFGTRTGPQSMSLIRDPGAFQTITMSYPGTKAVAAVPETVMKKGFRTVTLPGTPAVPATPGRRVTTRVPVGETSAPQRTPSQKAIDYLRSHPETSDQFDAWFGEGTSDSFLETEEQTQEE